MTNIEALNYWEVFKKEIKDFKRKYPNNTNWEEQEEATVIAINALEKQIPKKPNEYYDGYADGNPVIEFECPNCGAELEADFDHHCRCGQAIDWSEEV